MKIHLDMDEVIVDFLGDLLHQYNKRYGHNIKITDITEWELEKTIGKEGTAIFRQPGFFRQLKPMPGALAAIRKLHDDGHKIFIISSPQNAYSVFEKYLWVEEYLPYLLSNLILTENKIDLIRMLDYGVLFDDCADYLDAYFGVTVAMDMPYNKKANPTYRVKNWEEFLSIIKGGDAN